MVPQRPGDFDVGLERGGRGDGSTPPSLRKVPPSPCVSRRRLRQLERLLRAESDVVFDEDADWWYDEKNPPYDPDVAEVRVSAWCDWTVDDLRQNPEIAQVLVRFFGDPYRRLSLNTLDAHLEDIRRLHWRLSQAGVLTHNDDCVLKTACKRFVLERRFMLERHKYSLLTLKQFIIPPGMRLPSKSDHPFAGVFSVYLHLISLRAINSFTRWVDAVAVAMGSGEDVCYTQVVAFALEQFEVLVLCAGRTLSKREAQSVERKKLRTALLMAFLSWGNAVFRDSVLVWAEKHWGGNGCLANKETVQNILTSLSVHTLKAAITVARLRQFLARARAHSPVARFLSQAVGERVSLSLKGYAGVRTKSAGARLAQSVLGESGEVAAGRSVITASMVNGATDVAQNTAVDSTVSASVAPFSVESPTSSPRRPARGPRANFAPSDELDVSCAAAREAQAYDRIFEAFAATLPQDEPRSPDNVLLRCKDASEFGGALVQWGERELDRLFSYCVSSWHGPQTWKQGLFLKLVYAGLWTRVSERCTLPLQPTEIEEHGLLDATQIRTLLPPPEHPERARAGDVWAQLANDSRLARYVTRASSG